MKKISVLFTAFLFVLGSVKAQDAIPDITLYDINGNKVNISDYATDGKIQIFSFWATWCSPCVKELSNIQGLIDDWRNNYDVQLVAVTIDNAKNSLKVKPFVEGKGWDYDVLFDINEDLKRALNAPSVPYTILLDKTGQIVYTHNGYVEGDEFELEKKIKEIAKK